MEKRFRALRFVATLLKVLAWITLVLGFLSSVGVLVMGLAGGGMLSRLGQEYGFNLAFGVVTGLVGFVLSPISTVIYFFLMYAGGELIYLLLAIEENTRSTAMWVSHNTGAYPTG